MSKRTLVPISHASMGLALLLCSGTIVSCSSQQERTIQQISATEHIEDPIRTLEARAELESLNPLPRADDALIRRLLQDTTEALTPGTETYRKALLTADEIEINPIPGFANEIPEEEIDPIRKGHALKIYTRARTLRQLGQLEQAIEGLNKAIELDPTSSKLYIMLGDSYTDLGDTLSADAAYEQAIEFGDRSASTLVALASSAYARNDYQRVMSFCTVALQDTSRTDTVAKTLAGIMLGNAQIRLGYLRAGAESLEQALDSFNPELRDTRWRQQLIQIQGRRPGLWVMVGDAWSRIGSHARAANAYTKAAEFSNGATGGLTSRRIAEHLREGHPATGALLLIDHILKHVHDLSPLEGDWVETLSQLPSLTGTLNDAIGSVRRDQDPVNAQTRRALMGLEIRGLSAVDALDRLGRAGTDARNADAITRVLLSLNSLEDCLAWARSLAELNPIATSDIADALLRLPHAPTDVLNAIQAADLDSKHLELALSLRMNRPDLSDLATFDPQVTEHGSEALSAVVQVAAQQGSWDLAKVGADELFARAVTADTNDRRSAIAAAIIMQQPSLALKYAQQNASTQDATTDDLLDLARVASTLGNLELARDTLARAFDRSPSDTRIADRYIRLVGAGGPLADEETLQSIVRRVSEAAPRSTFFSQLRAGELARNGLLNEAESVLMQINEQRPGDILGQDLLLSIWKTQETQGDPDALNRGEGWLSVRINEFPGAVQAGISLAQIKYEREEIDEAQEILWNLRQRTGSMDVARVHEQLLRELGDQDALLSSAEQRLGTSNGIDATIEYAQILARTGDAANAELASTILNENIPSGIELYPAQVQQLTQVIYALAEQADSNDVDAPMIAIVDMIEDRTGSLSFYLARTKLLLNSRKPRIDLDEIIAMIEHYSAQFDPPAQKQQLEALPIQVLLGEDRTHEAIALVTRMSTNAGDMKPDLIIETFRLLGAVGESSDLLGVLDAYDDVGIMMQVIELTTNRLGTPERPNKDLSNEEQRADLAYTAGAMAAAFDRQEQSESFMRLAISFDENHGWSNNDLGYQLLEQGKQIDDAARMLQIAAEALPDQSNVIDSLGWLRYKQGIYEDVVDEMTGQVMTQGAISLLARANRLDNERTNATILLHLGDAFWRAGKASQAVEAWVGGENMLRSRLRLLNAQPPESRNQRAIDALSEELRELRYRVQDAEAGSNPKIAPIFSETNETQEPTIP